MAEQKRHRDVPYGAVFGKPFPKRHKYLELMRMVFSKIPEQPTG